MIRSNVTMRGSGETVFAAYAGSSMDPTLREPEIIEVVPYEGRPLRIGDVALFLSPEAGRLVVHRIVRVTPAGVSTLGDNNTGEDRFLLQAKSIKGRVVAAWRGRKRRRIAGGYRGRWTGRWCRWRRALDRGVSSLLRPFYHALIRRGLIARWLPAGVRPRVVVFQARGRDRSRLLWGRHVIGRYDDRHGRWLVRRPCRLFVDERTL